VRARIVLVVVVGAFVAATLWLFVLAPSAHPRHDDAIVVLAGDRDRLDTGLRLLREDVAPTLVLSRDPAPWHRAAELCARSDFVCIHAHPYSTQGEAETVRRLARRHGWHRIVVVTSRYHLRRARMLFRRCLHSTPAFVAASTTFWDYVENIPWEWAKLVYQATIDRGC
jgi:uncharacterized SAM-binding protein YcdF (DUF218 family)